MFDNSINFQNPSLEVLKANENELQAKPNAVEYLISNLETTKLKFSQAVVNGYILTLKKGPGYNASSKQVEAHKQNVQLQQKLSIINATLCTLGKSWQHNGLSVELDTAKPTITLIADNKEIKQDLNSKLTIESEVEKFLNQNKKLIKEKCEDMDLNYTKPFDDMLEYLNSIKNSHSKQSDLPLSQKAKTLTKSKSLY